MGIAIVLKIMKSFLVLPQKRFDDSSISDFNLFHYVIEARKMSLYICMHRAKDMFINRVMCVQLLDY